MFCIPDTIHLLQYVVDHYFDSAQHHKTDMKKVVYCCQEMASEFFTIEIHELSVIVCTVSSAVTIYGIVTRYTQLRFYLHTVWNGGGAESWPIKSPGTLFNSTATPTWIQSTWIEPMVVINSQPWGIGHWFVFKRVCVHCIGNRHERYLFFRLFFNQLYLSINPQTHQSHRQEGQHPNGTSDYKDKTKLT